MTIRAWTRVHDLFFYSWKFVGLEEREARPGHAAGPGPGRAAGPDLAADPGRLIAGRGVDSSVARGLARGRGHPRLEDRAPAVHIDALAGPGRAVETDVEADLDQKMVSDPGEPDVGLSTLCAAR